MDEILIEPIEFIPPGRCIECGGHLVVLDTEMSLMELNDDGVPLNEETTVKCRGVCTKCGKKYNMARIGTGYISYTNPIILKQLMIEQTARNFRRLQESRITKNPLAYNNEENKNKGE